MRTRRNQEITKKLLGGRTDLGAARSNGSHKRLHVISPATASEIRRALGIKPYQRAMMLQAFNAVGVKV